MLPARARAAAVAGCALLIAGSASTAATPGRVAADVSGVAGANGNQGWDANEPRLTQQGVAGLPTTPRFSVPVDGVVYTQPVIDRGVVIVATEHDKVYGVDTTSGQLRWSHDLGPYEPDSHNCSQVTPHLGITSTPVIDPATDTVYVVARNQFSAGTASWSLHALDVFSGTERQGWPVAITGSASNDPSLQFDPYQHQQRPGLLLLAGQVFAGFGSFCDQAPYQGWIAGVSTSTRALHLWTTEPGQGTGAAGALWMSGGGLVADSAGRMFIAVANGVVPAVGAGASGPLGNAAARLIVAADGTLSAQDMFAGYNAVQQSSADSDLGSGAPTLLPDSMGTASHPHLLVVGDKYGVIYVLDRDNLGGRSPDQATEKTHVVSEISGDNRFSHPAVWPGDGGYVLITGNSAHLRAYRIDGTGAISVAGSAANGTGYGAGSPLVTSNGTTSGSAVAWITNSTGNELEAYDPVPHSGTLTELWHASIGTQTRFSQVASTDGGVYVGTADGHLLAFGLAPSAPPPPPPGHNPGSAQGYWQVAADGGIFPWGNAGGYGSTGGMHLNQPIVGMAATPSAHGYWLVASDGGIFPFGDAGGYGSTGGMRLNQPIVGMAGTPTGRGYWLVAADGGVFPFGDAGGYGSTGGVRLNQPMVGMAATSAGRGYWVVARDGGIFPFGDAGGYGSTGGMRLNQPIVGMAATRDGGGYWLVASDGGIFPFGDAGGLGSTGGIRLNQPIVGMAATGDGGGYWLSAADGGLFPFGDAIGYGSEGGTTLNRPIVGITAA